MQIGIDSVILSLDTSTAIRRAKSLGFRLIEIGLRPEEAVDSQKRKNEGRLYKSLRQELDTLGLSVWAANLLEPQSLAQIPEPAHRDLLVGGAVAAGILGGRLFVVRPGELFRTESEFKVSVEGNSAPPLQPGFDEAWAQGANRRVSLALRNASYLNKVDHLAKASFDLGIGWALDIRAALQAGELTTWLTAGGDRLGTAYLYDVNDVGKPQLPASDDWAMILKQLKATRLQTIILSGGREHSDDEILASKQFIERLAA